MNIEHIEEILQYAAVHQYEHCQEETPDQLAAQKNEILDALRNGRPFTQGQSDWLKWAEFLWDNKEPEVTAFFAPAPPNPRQ